MCTLVVCKDTQDVLDIFRCSRPRTRLRYKAALHSDLDWILFIRDTSAETNKNISFTILFYFLLDFYFNKQWGCWKSLNLLRTKVLCCRTGVNTELPLKIWSAWLCVWQLGKLHPGSLDSGYWCKNNSGLLQSEIYLKYWLQYLNDILLSVLLKYYNFSYR